jgi:flagellar motor switch protein FliN/FliY
MTAPEPVANEPRGGYDPAFAKLIQDLDNYLELPIRIDVLIGTRLVKIRELISLEPGYILDLKRSAGESLIIGLNNVHFAKGEVTVIEDTFGVRITEINDPRKV